MELKRSRIAIVEKRMISHSAALRPPWQCDTKANKGHQLSACNCRSNPLDWASPPSISFHEKPFASGDHLTSSQCTPGHGFLKSKQTTMADFPDEPFLLKHLQLLTQKILSNALLSAKHHKL